MRVLVVGCGGLGGIVAGTLVDSGLPVDVVALTTNDAIATAAEARGLQLRGEGGARTVKVRVARDLAAGTPPFDVVVLATQPPDVERAASRALPFLAADGRMVCLQNGLCEQRVAAIEGVGAERVVGAVVAWAAAMPEPGVYDRTSAGGFTLGRLDGKVDDPQLDRLAMLLEPIGPVTTTPNLAGARWSKLAINCNVSTLGTIGGGRLGPLMLHRAVRRLALEIMTEVVHVARAEKVRLEKVAGTLDLEWIALTEAERKATGSPSLVAKHSMLLAVGARYRRMRSSMLAAIERGKTPAVDFLNGEVTTRARRHGIEAPFNEAVRRTVHEIAAGKQKPAFDTLDRLCRELGV